MIDRFRSLDLNLLRVFEALIQEGNVTRAAERLCLTQPAVSNALARLRIAFGDTLFEKTRSGVSATPAAHAVWQAIEPHYQGMRQALAPGSFDPATFSGRMRLAMTDYTIARVMPRLMAMLQSRAPHLQLHIAPYDLMNLPALLDKSVDLALGTYVDDASQRSGFSSHALWSIDYALLLRQGHPLTQGPMDRQSFLRARHIDARTQDMHAGVYDQVLAAHGVKRNLVLVLHSFQQTLAILQASDCVAVLPRSLLDDSPYANTLQAMPPPIPLPARDLSVLWHHRHASTPAHRWLRTQIITLFTSAPAASSAPST